jgi:putative FmdB family regulatory protein
MPIYEYECQKCKAHIEILQKVTDKPLTKCPKCKGKLEKQWSNTSFQLKGSGWYVTDYASKKADDKAEKKKTVSETASKEEKTPPPAQDSTIAPKKPEAATKAPSSNAPSGD